MLVAWGAADGSCSGWAACWSFPACCSSSRTAVGLAPIVRLRTARSRDGLEATVSLRVRRANLVVAGLAFTVLTILGAHLFAENAGCWFGSSVAC
jgi:hypothetical protein